MAARRGGGNRWSRSAAGYSAAKTTAERFCAGCWCTEAEGKALRADGSDTRAYCEDCWSKWNRQTPTQATYEQRRQRCDQMSKDVRDATTVPHTAVSEAATAYTPAVDVECLDVETNVDEIVPVPESVPGSPTQSDSNAAVSTSRFTAEVDALRAAHPTALPEADALQREELETLEAIFGEALRITSADGEVPRLLRLELPVAASDGGHVDLFVHTQDGEVPAGVVEVLPPAVLTIALPGDYPLEGGGAPILMISEVSHLDAEAQSQIEADLCVRAAAGDGEQRLFDLTTEFQERLIPPKRLVLRDVLGGMDSALGLLAHNRRAQDARRQLEVHNCLICFDQLAGSAGIFLACGHFGCRGCLGEMARLHVAEADLAALRCPMPDCRRDFDVAAVRTLLEAVQPELLARWEELSLKRCLEYMQDVVFCPRCDEVGDGQRVPCIVEEEDQMATCGACGFVFCGRCRNVFHPGTACQTIDDRLGALEARAAGYGPEAAAAKAELLTLRHLARTSKRCPRCDMAIEKSEGCSKVVCSNCNTKMCWRCGKEINGYDHFATGECRLFDDEEIRRWNQQMRTVDRNQVRAQEARFLRRFVDPEQLREQSRQCPRCKALVIRDGKNNHLRCHACQTNFCGRCMEMLPKKNPGDHFQKLRICPQHSD